MKKVQYVTILLMVFHQVYGQVYIEKQTRHRFAQMNIGLDYQSDFGGSTKYIDGGGEIQSLDLGSLQKPRILIGGTHFWGHADFYIAIPLFTPAFEKESLSIHYSSSVETVFKYYPLRIEHHKVRPFIGVSLAPFTFRQSYDDAVFGEGPELVHTSLPVVTGMTYNTHQHLVEASLLWNYTNQQDYYISRTVVAGIKTPPVYVSLSYKYMFETTLSAEPDWESGRTEQVTKALAEKQKLNGFFIGIGLSSSFWHGPSTYNDLARPYIMDYPISIMPDFAFGYYLHKPDINIALSYRSYGTSTKAYGATQDLRRRSFGLEVTKGLFDYHGFVPFAGPFVGLESLSFVEHFENQPTYDITDQQVSYGLTFGWDIRPSSLQTWLLRTNLRWFPDLKLQVEGDAGISFDNVEFNFIQLVVYPGRF